MKLFKLMSLIVVSSFIVIGCGGGSDAPVGAEDILVDNSFYNCRQSYSDDFGEDVYVKMIFTSDELKSGVFRTSDDTQYDLSEDGVIDDDDYIKAPVTYSGNSIYIDADGGTDCTVSDNGIYVELECTDASSTETVILYKTKEDAVDNCIED